MDNHNTRMLNFPGLLRPADPFEVIRESIISVFCPSGPYSSSKTDTCRLCKRKQTNNKNKELVVRVNSFGTMESRRLLRGTLQSLFPKPDGYRYQQVTYYDDWGGPNWELTLCVDCAGLLKKLSEMYFEFERVKTTFLDTRRRLSKAIVVEKLKIPEKVYEKWERELGKSVAEEEAPSKMSKDVTGEGPDKSISSESINAAPRVQEEEIKTEEEEESRRGNFFEEIEIEPDPDPTKKDTEPFLPTGIIAKPGKVQEKDLPKKVKRRRVSPILEGFVYHSSNVPLKTYGSRKQRKEGNDESSKSKQLVPGATVAEQKAGDPVQVVSSSTSFEEEMEICPEQLFNDKSFSNQVTVSVGISALTSQRRRKQTLAVVPTYGESKESSEIVFIEEPTAPIISTPVDDTDRDFRDKNVPVETIDLLSEGDEIKSEIDLEESDDPLADVVAEEPNGPLVLTSMTSSQDNTTLEKDPGSSNDNKRLFSCPYCWREYTSGFHYLMAHVRRSHPNKFNVFCANRRRFSCPYKKVFQCSYCPNFYSNQPNLKYHLKIVHGVGVGLIVYKCPSCPEKFKGPMLLLKHRRIKHGYQPPPKGPTGPSGRKQYLCSICTYSTEVSNKALRRHMEKCHEVLDSSSLRLQCSHCEENFAEVSKLEVHKIRVHSLGSLNSAGHSQCPYCLKFFAKEWNLLAHAKDVHKVLKGLKGDLLNVSNTATNIFCSFCERSVMTSSEEVNRSRREFAGVAELGEHAKTTEHLEMVEGSVSNVYCGVCRISFGKDGTEALARHLACDEHTRELYEVRKLMDNNQNNPVGFCVPCREDCKSKDGLSSHRKSTEHCKLLERFQGQSVLVLKRAKVQNVEFPCSQCPRVYRDRSNYKKHLMNMHSIADDYPCEFCDLKLKDRKSWFSHRRVHKDQIPVNAICQHCGKGFKDSKTLSAHVRYVHRGDPTLCDACGKVFNTSAAMKSHKSNYHASNKDCRLCGKNYKKSDMLRRHLYSKHKEDYTKDSPFVCLICFRKFPLEANLEAHSAAHDSTTCKECSKVFYSKTELDSHFQKKHTKEGRKLWEGVKCELCGKLSRGPSAVKRHQLSHERKARPASFHCGECGKKFYVEKWLGWHKKKTGHC